MLEILIILAVLGGCVWMAVRAFARPRGVYVRSAIGFGLAVLVALAAWWAASPLISDAAGLGAFLLFVAAVTLAACVALIACAAATLRHVCNALKSG